LTVAYESLDRNVGVRDVVGPELVPWAGGGSVQNRACRDRRLAFADEQPQQAALRDRTGREVPVQAGEPRLGRRVVGADLARVNVCGGAIALGHPLGATGARLLTTLVHALARTGCRYGLLTMCEGGGQANVTIIERL
jgi:Thiolase, C-terminal domain